MEIFSFNTCHIIGAWYVQCKIEITLIINKIRDLAIPRKATEKGKKFIGAADANNKIAF